MKILLVRLCFALAATTSVYAQDVAASKPISRLPAIVLEQCKKAPNCELYDTTDGLLIRFVPGMEPGTASYNATFIDTANATESTLAKRANFRTFVTMGRNSINYGTANPQDAFHHCAYDYCHEVVCEPSECTFDTKVTGSWGTLGYGPVDRKIKIQSRGGYNSWDERNRFVEAIKAASSKGQQWSNHDWSINWGTWDNPVLEEGTQVWKRQADWIDVTRISDSGLRSNMQVQAWMEQSNSGWCSIIAGALGAIAGAIEPIGGYFFLGIQACCDKC